METIGLPWTWLMGLRSMLRNLIVPALLLLPASAAGEAGEDRPYGLDSGPGSRAFLDRPPDERGAIPSLLSQTGAFTETRTLKADPALIPYDLNVAFWSDGAAKSRWISLPRGGSGQSEKIRFSPTGEWKFPPGTVFVKHFELATDETRPDQRRRLETRLLVCDRAGGVYGVSYKWRPDGMDADLIREGQVEPIAIRTARGSRIQNWQYPGPADCRQCHTPASGGVLGVNARQLNGDLTYPRGRTDNQLHTWNRLGLFEPAVAEADIARLPRLARGDDAGRSLEDRARSYLDANCSQCHRPGGVVADFDARYDTPLANQGLIGAPVRIDLGIDGARVIAPNDPWRSTILGRVETTEPTRMPPLAHEVIDRRGAELLRAWIGSLPGTPALAPPTIRPKGGDYRGPVRVTLGHPDPGAVLRYTLDGTAPGKVSTAYEGPIEIRRSTTIRARAYKAGWTRSIAAQETLIVVE